MHDYTKTELRKLLENWDIPNDLTINNVKIAGTDRYDDSEWSVGNSYILKTGDRVQRLKHLRIAKALGTNGFPASLPVKTKTGAEFLDAENIFILSRVIPGAPLESGETGPFLGEKREAYARECGIGIAKLHRALKAVEPDILPNQQDLYSHVTEWALPNVRLQNKQWGMGLEDCFFDDYIKTFGSLFAGLQKQLIHRNPCPSYIFFEDGKVSGFEDFDLSERNVRLWDPCYCATGILSEASGQMYEVWPDVLAAILRGYHSVNPLTAEEKKAVYYVICSIQMICVAFFENCEEYKDLAKTNREMLAFIVRNRQKIDGIF